MRLQELIQLDEDIKVGDHFDLELDDLVIETVVVDIVGDDIVIEADDTALNYLGLNETSRPMKSFNRKPMRTGNEVPYDMTRGGAAVDQWEVDADDRYTRYIPRGADIKTGWAAEEDVFKSNIRLAAKFYEEKKFEKAKEVLEFLMQKIKQLSKSPNPQDQEAADYFGDKISQSLEKINKKIGTNLTPKKMIKRAASAPADTGFYKSYLSARPPRGESAAEGYKIVRDIDRERYSDRAGLEGPFQTKSGKVVYYDAKEGMYYDPDTDMYIDHDEWAGLNEAKYQGREVPLGKKMAGDVKKSKVYVRKPDGKVVKVNFGDKKMRIKKSNPERRKSFRARHNCKNPGPRWKARYWSCRSW
jgi:hypothetical protein